MSSIRFALIGAGNIARSYLEILATCDFVELVAVVDENVEAAVRASEGQDPRIFTSHTSLLRECDFDAALICTPPTSHAPIALDLLGSGKHVLCEKPFSVDVASARLMLLAAERAGVVLALASKFRYVGDVVQARALIESGLVGEVVTFENSFTSHVSMAGRWNANPLVSGGGVIIDNGSHSVDILRYLCGPITAVAAYEGERVQRLPVEDSAHVVARTSRGVLGSIDLSWSYNQEADSYVRVCGTEGALALGWARSKYSHGGSHAWISFGSGYNKLDALRGEIENFCRAVRNEEELLITAADALGSVEAISAAYRSLRADRWITTDAFEDMAIVDAPGLTPVSAAR